MGYSRWRWREPSSVKLFEAGIEDQPGFAGKQNPRAPVEEAETLGAEDAERSLSHHRIVALGGAGGQVDITSGKFVFSCTEAYVIEDGRVGAPVKGATLIGNGPDVLTKASMIGNDMALDPGIGTCGKEGQGVPVGVGQPTIKVDSLTVGGTAV